MKYPPEFRWVCGPVPAAIQEYAYAEAKAAVIDALETATVYFYQDETGAAKVWVSTEHENIGLEVALEGIVALGCDDNPEPMALALEAAAKRIRGG